MPKGICPECDGDVQIGASAGTGDIITCEDCGTDLEIVGLDPVELDAVLEEEDEDDDEY